MKNIFRIIISTFAVALFGAFSSSVFEPFFTELCRKIGIDPVSWVAPLLGQFHSTLFITVMVYFAGFACGMWAQYLNVRFETKRSKNSGRPNTRLRFKIDPAGTKLFLEEYRDNIDAWQQTIVAMGADHSNILHVDNLSITFESPVSYSRPIVEGKDGSVGAYNFYPLSNKGAVFQFFGPIQASEVDVWFPPPDFYERKTAFLKEQREVA